MTFIDATPDTQPRGKAGGDARHTYARKRTETKLLCVPSSVVVSNLLADAWLADLVAAQPGPTSALVASASGVVIHGASTVGAYMMLKRADATDKLPATKQLAIGTAVTGAIMPLLGGETLAQVVYIGLAAAATAAWHKLRLTVRRQLHKELMPPKPPGRRARTDDLARIAPAPVEPGPAEPPAHGPTENELILTQYEKLWTNVARIPAHGGSNVLRSYTEGDRWVLIIQGPDQGIDMNTIRASEPRVRGAMHLRLPDEDGRGGFDVLIDQPLGAGLTASQYRVQIVPTDAPASRSARLAVEGLHHPDNRGTVSLGHYIDDGSPYWWVIGDHDGAHSGVIIAGTGMGKSYMVDQLAYRAAQLGYQIAWIDPQSGASSPVLNGRVHFPALGQDAAQGFLNFLEDAAQFREDWMTMHGLGKITFDTVAPCAPHGTAPDPNCPCGGVVPPGIYAFVEEADQVFAGLGDAFGAIAKRGRKLNIAIVAVTQYPGLPTFGHSEMLRSNLAMRNFFAMHVASNSSGAVIPGLPFNPKELPKIKGRGVAVSENSRVMPVALDFGPRREDAKKHDGPYTEDLFDAPGLMVDAYPLDLVAANTWLTAIGEDAVTASRSEAASRFAARLAGSPPQVSGRRVRAEIGPAALAGDDLVPPIAGLTAAEVDALDAVFADALDAASRPTQAQQVLNAIAGRGTTSRVTWAELARALGLVDSTTERGEVSRVASALAAELDPDNTLPRHRTAQGFTVAVADLRRLLDPAGGEHGSCPVDPDLLAQAAELIIVAQFGSQSMLQRKLRIGFEQAQLIMDTLTEIGVLGPQVGAQARDVLYRADRLHSVLHAIRNPHLMPV